jgi:hypothetical protein
MAVIVKHIVLRVGTMYDLVDVHQHFGETRCFYFQGRRATLLLV